MNETPDTRPLFLPADQIDDAVELLEGACETLKCLEQQLRDHFVRLDPLSPSKVLGLIRVCRAACRVVGNTLCAAEAAAADTPND